MGEPTLIKSDLWKNVPIYSGKIDIKKELKNKYEQLDRIVVVIDDDPTGIQTVHGVNVYTDWNYELLREAFGNENLIYIQTNSRAMSPEEAIMVNEEIIKIIITVSAETGREFSVISRSDSTLRGHYPLETNILRQIIELETGKIIDGEILIFFFLEGGRFTYNDIHYVQENNKLVPAAQTEFAQDSVFSFLSSNLKYYVEEKTKGKYSHENVISIDLNLIRKGDIDEIVRLLMSVNDFNKVIVNALSYEDLEVFTLALLIAEERGKRFIFRTASSFARVYGMVSPKALLNRNDFKKLSVNRGQGTLVIVGSHVKKTTEQLKYLLKLPNICAIEIDVEQLLGDKNCRDATITQVVRETEKSLNNNLSPVLFTSRLLVKDNQDPQKNISIAKNISAALVEIVSSLHVEPACIIAKGGITSSDLAVKALGVVKAKALGQVLPGVPVIETGFGSKWPGMPFIIFPGNVGDETSLMQAFQIVNSA